LVRDRLTGFTDIMVWSATTAPAPRATLDLATRISALTGLRTHVSEGGTALDRDPQTGESTAHTLPAPDGPETGWRSVSGDDSGGALMEVPVVREKGEACGRALERALDRGASFLPASPGTPYARLVAGLAEEDLPASAPLIDLAADVHLGELDRAGI